MAVQRIYRHRNGTYTARVITLGESECDCGPGGASGGGGETLGHVGHVVSEGRERTRLRARIGTDTAGSRDQVSRLLMPCFYSHMHTCSNL